MFRANTMISKLCLNRNLKIAGKIKTSLAARGNCNLACQTKFGQCKGQSQLKQENDFNNPVREKLTFSR